MTFARAIRSGALARTTSMDSALRMAATVLAIVSVSILTFVPLSQNDFWLQAAVGRIIVQTGEIPHTVLFPFTGAQHNLFYAHEWLPSIAFYLLESTIGYDRLVFVQGALGLLLFGLCFGLAFRLSQSNGTALLFACMAMLVANYRHWLRPELFALVLLLVQLHLLTHYRLRGERRALFWCLPLAVVWANSHGSFVLGPIIAGIFALGEAIEAARQDAEQPLKSRLRAGVRAALPWAAVAVSMTLVSLVNPLGADIFHFVRAVSGSDVFKAGIGEWKPTFSSLFMGMRGFWIFVGSVVVTVAVCVSCWRRLSATDVLLLVAFFVVATMRLRYVVLFGFVAMVVCSRLIGTGAWGQASERVALAISFSVSAIVIALALQFGNGHGAYPFFVRSDDFSEPMVEQLSKADMKGNVFNSYPLGAELIYRAYPRLRPSIDSRGDSYGEGYFLAHKQLFFDEAKLSQFISEFDVRYMLVTRGDFELLKKMPGLRVSWKIQLVDHKAVLLARSAQALPLEAAGLSVTQLPQTRSDGFPSR